VAIRSDAGEPIVLSRPDSVAAKEFIKLAENCNKFVNPQESAKAG